MMKNSRTIENVPVRLRRQVRMETPNVAAAVAELSTTFRDFMASQDKRMTAVERVMDDMEKAANRMGLGGAGGPLRDAVPGNINAYVDSFFSEIKGHAVVAGPAEYEALENYRNGQQQYLRRGPAGVSSAVTNELSVGSDPGGGYLVGPFISQNFITRIAEISPIRELADVQLIGAGDAFEQPIDAESVEGGWVSEQETRSETAVGDMGMQRIPVHEQYCQPVASQQFLDDAFVNVEDWLSRKMAEKFAALEGTSFVTGNGIAKPRGFLDYSAAATSEADGNRAWGKLQYVPTGADGDLPPLTGGEGGVDCLHDMIAALKEEFHQNARWVMNRATSAKLRKLKDSLGRPLWTDGLATGQPATLLGYPVKFVPGMPSFVSGSIPIAFGDFRRGYKVIDRLRMTILRDPYTTKGKVKFYARRRVGGDVQHFEAIKLLKASAE